MNKERKMAERARYWEETYKNKICALALIWLGGIGTFISGDGTALVLFACIAVPMFFSKKNWILD